MLRKYFEYQLDNHPIITTTIYSRIEYKRVWSGNMMEVGDRVLYAYVKTDNEKTLQFMCLLERELDQLSTIFTFIGKDTDTIPLLKFTDSTRNKL